jgi:SpoVK/Ycf46/Vps4 family AAA+-type ATPase
MEKSFTSGARFLSALANIINGNADLPSESLEYDDLFIEPSTARDIKDLNIIFNQSQVRDRGSDKSSNQGTIVLFEGAADTTKRVVADLLAKQAGVETTYVNLSKLASKYMGETEKNLAAIFASAAETGNILVFEEAEALFGKRTDVKDAHDKYANIEVSGFLKQAMDSSNLQIIAVKQKNELTDELLRRVRTVISFPAKRSL